MTSSESADAPPPRPPSWSQWWTELPVTRRYPALGFAVGLVVCLGHLGWWFTTAVPPGEPRPALIPALLAAPLIGATAGFLTARVARLMGATLFEYVFKDLVRIFALTSGALTGIMSFAGLLRPLTQQGLDAGQVVQVLAYFTPAMTAYSLPVAALFAASVVYGRLSADNELTACRAGGVSLGPFLGMAFPGLLFGLLVAGASLLLLCFVVPTYTLKVERVVYSNLAKLIANRIERTHEIRFSGANIFAQRAYLPPPDPNEPNRQIVKLYGVSIVQYEKGDPARPATGPAMNPSTSPPPKPGAGNRPAAAADPAGGGDDQSDPLGAVAAGGRGKFDRVPKEFLLASTATIEIREREEDDQASLTIYLEGGTKFPRELRGGTQIGIEATQFGPMEIPSPVKEDVKFMDVVRLRELYANPEQSKNIGRYTADFVRREQIRQYIEWMRDELNDKDKKVVRFVDGPTEIKVVRTAADAPPARIEGEDRDELVVPGKTPGTVGYERRDASTQELSAQSARELHVKVRPDNARRRMSVTIELLDRSPGGASGARPVSGNYSSAIAVEMPAGILAVKDRKLKSFVTDVQLPRKDRDRLRREMVVLSNNILAEVNGRASFAVSCLILVMVGAALGMMFRSGNFLTAFAVSFIPAALCITLIVSGQQMAHAVPYKIDTQTNPLKAGIAFIWSGNALNLVIAVWLLWKLQRQ